MATIYDTSATQAAPLGSEYRQGIDRVFRYTKNASGALAVGTVVQAFPPNDSHRDLTCAAAAVGKTAVTVTLAHGDPVFTDEYKEGYLFINDQAGEGYLYDVAGHTVAGGEDATLKVNIRDHIVVALTTSSQATLVKNPYSGANKPGSTPWEVILGAVPVAVPANHYFWCQVHGPAVVLQSGGLFPGLGVMLSQQKPGAVEVLKQVVPVYREKPQELHAVDTVGRPTATEGMPFLQKGVELGSETDMTPSVTLTEVPGKATIPERVIGYCINPRVSTEYALIYLTLS